jgi:hypothetical protein
MTFIRRWAFWPLLALLCMAAASAALNAEHGSIEGTLVGLALSVPLAILIDRAGSVGGRPVGNGAFSHEREREPFVLRAAAMQLFDPGPPRANAPGSHAEV